MIIQEIEKKGKTLEEKSLPLYLQKCRWFAHKNLLIEKVFILDSIEIIPNESALLLLNVTFQGDESKKYWLPICTTDEEITKNNPEACIDESFADAIYQEKFQVALLKVALQGKTINGKKGFIKGSKSNFPNKIEETTQIKSQFFRAEQSNSAILYNNEIFLKLYRQAIHGLNRENELIKFLNETTSFKSLPAYMGSVEYYNEEGQNTSLAILQSYIPNDGTAWDYVLSLLKEAFDKNSVSQEFLKRIEELGELTANLHLALSSYSVDEEFQPSKQTLEDSLTQVKSIFAKLKSSNLPTNEKIQQVLEKEADLMSFMENVAKEHFDIQSIYTHQDYHLGQLLSTKNEQFIVIDFEGEPNNERNQKMKQGLALEDVAGMLRSFSYAISSIQSKEALQLSSFNDFRKNTYKIIYDTFINSYLNETIGKNFLPKDKQQFDTLLKFFLLRKALYEVNYELNNRPDWIFIPIDGLLELIK